MLQTQWTAVIDLSGDEPHVRDIPYGFAAAVAHESAARTANWPASVSQRAHARITPEEIWRLRANVERAFSETFTNCPKQY